MSPRVPITHLNSYHPRADPFFPTPHISVSRMLWYQFPRKPLGFSVDVAQLPLTLFFYFPFYLTLGVLLSCFQNIEIGSSTFFFFFLDYYVALLYLGKGRESLSAWFSILI